MKRRIIALAVVTIAFILVASTLQTVFWPHRSGIGLIEGLVLMATWWITIEATPLKKSPEPDKDNGQIEDLP